MFDLLIYQKQEVDSKEFFGSHIWSGSWGWERPMDCLFQATASSKKFSNTSPKCLNQNFNYIFSRF